MTRVRNACAYATHRFFQDRAFRYIHTPIVTTADCEGAGEMFAVTTTLPKEATVSAHARRVEAAAEAAATAAAAVAPAVARVAASVS